MCIVSRETLDFSQKIAHFSQKQSIYRKKQKISHKNRAFFCKNREFLAKVEHLLQIASKSRKKPQKRWFLRIYFIVSRETTAKLAYKTHTKVKFFHFNAIQPQKRPSIHKKPRFHPFEPEQRNNRLFFAFKSLYRNDQFVFYF